MSVNLLRSAQNGQGPVLLCLEVNPPRGVTAGDIRDRLAPVVSGLDFFNVTDNALAMMRMAAIPFAAWLKNEFAVEPLVNFSCRDRNILGMQSDLLAGQFLGVNSIVALTGDAISVGDHQDCKGVFEVNSVGVLKLVGQMNSGMDFMGGPLQSATNYLPGVVVNPNARNPSAELKKLARKVEAGAKYALSQPVFDLETARSFFAEASALGIPLFQGLMPIGSVKVARNLNRIPGLRLSSQIENMLDRATDAELREFSLGLCMEIAEISRPHVCGFHVVSGVTPKLALKLLGSLKKRYKEQS